MINAWATNLIEEKRKHCRNECPVGIIGLKQITGGVIIEQLVINMSIVTACYWVKYSSYDLAPEIYTH